MTEVQFPVQCGVRGCHASVEKKTIGGLDQCVCIAASHHRAFLVEDGVKGVAWEFTTRGKGYLKGKLIGAGKGVEKYAGGEDNKGKQVDESNPTCADLVAQPPSSSANPVDSWLVLKTLKVRFFFLVVSLLVALRSRLACVYCLHAGY